MGAANWDIIWHGIINVESFFTPPHSVLYFGVGLSLVSTIAGIIWSLRHKIDSVGPFATYRKIPTPLKLIVFGCSIEVISGLFDNWWHANF